MIYLLNDLSDINADRRHPTKRNRPFASGILGWKEGRRLPPGGARGPVSLLFSLPFAITLVHVALTISYSVFLVHKMLIDMVCCRCSTRCA